MVAPAAAALILAAAAQPPAPPIALTPLGRAEIAPPADESAPRLGGLSGLASRNGALYAVSDSPRTPAIFRIDWSPGPIEGSLSARAVAHIPLSAPPVDAEAIVHDPRTDRWFVAWEQPPAVGAFDAAQGDTARVMLPIPRHVSEHARHNRAFESLALREEARELWAFTEAALTTDGPEATAQAGTRCRVIIYDADNFNVLRQHVYQTLPVSSPLGLDVGFNSLTDAAALPDGRILTLERSWIPPAGWGGTIRLITPGRGEADVFDAAPPDHPPLVAQTVATLADLGLSGVGNAEGMTVIRASDGALTLLIVTDDNFGRDGQTASHLAAFRIDLDP